MQVVKDSTTYSLLFKPTQSSVCPTAPTNKDGGMDGWYEHCLLARPDLPYVWLALGDGTSYAVCTTPVSISMDTPYPTDS